MRRLFCYSAILFVLGSCNAKKKDFTEEIINVKLTNKAISGGESPVLTKGDHGSEGNKYGFEGGTVIRLTDGYHLFSSEMAGDTCWVKMKLTHWMSTDGIDGIGLTFMNLPLNPPR